MFLAHEAGFGCPKLGSNREMEHFHDGSVPGGCGEFDFGNGEVAVVAATSIFAILGKEHGTEKSIFLEI